MNLLAGKSALITGATRGIGYSIANVFAANGVENLILFARDTERLTALKKDIESNFNTKVVVFQVDIKNQEDIKAAVVRMKEAKLSVDILVNNAGMMADGMLKMIKQEVMEDMFSTNVFGTILLTQLCISSMITKRKGSIINLSSVIGTKGYMGNSVYSATKSAIVGFTKSLSKEYASLNIRVNAIAPGLIQTDMTAGINPKMIETIGLKRIGQPEDVANLALFLASDLSSYITGQIIEVDGGMII